MTLFDFSFLALCTVFGKFVGVRSVRDEQALHGINVLAFSHSPVAARIRLSGNATNKSSEFRSLHRHYHPPIHETTQATILLLPTCVRRCDVIYGVCGAAEDRCSVPAGEAARGGPGVPAPREGAAAGEHMSDGAFVGADEHEYITPLVWLP